MSRLTPLQLQVLEVLAPMSPRWTLSGGAALAGFHLHHRTTRDLDLFWHATHTLADHVRQAERLLVRAGLDVTAIQRSETFARLRANARDEAVVIDLVAEPVPVADPPQEMTVGNSKVLVDTPHEILTNKLGTLLHRAEPRDLVDLRELVGRGGDLRRALRDAARKDGGFSPLTVGWALQGFEVVTRATALGMSESEANELDQFRQRLRDDIAALARP